MLEHTTFAVAIITHYVDVVAHILIVPSGLFDWLEAKIQSQEEMHRVEIQGQGLLLQEEKLTILFSSLLWQSSHGSPQELPMQRATIVNKE